MNWFDEARIHYVHTRRRGASPPGTWRLPTARVGSPFGVCVAQKDGDVASKGRSAMAMTISARYDAGVGVLVACSKPWSPVCAARPREGRFSITEADAHRCDTHFRKCPPRHPRGSLGRDDRNTSPDRPNAQLRGEFFRFYSKKCPLFRAASPQRPGMLYCRHSK